ncbi:hypothetical protein K7X08_037665 [Anisodus acutangulus]|uniref:Pentatricopeptide repeat-containing protein n=1 Tax=Anisodus acutangulus TaxID=402998 RepID=A0A9Q1MY91_9SOLA|nr:hypothetical protein K7X08_037665 [Anisodus acutangulus]
MQEAEVLLNEMQSKGIDIDRVIFNTTIDGYCKQGSVDEALRVQRIMEGKGHEPDANTYNIIATGLRKLDLHEEAKRVILWKQRALIEMETKEIKPNTATYTTLIDGYFKHGNFIDAKSPSILTRNLLAEKNSVQLKAL